MMITHFHVSFKLCLDPKKYYIKKNNFLIFGFIMGNIKQN